MNQSTNTPRPLFVYGTLQALPLLAWALTRDAANIDIVAKLARPAKVKGYARYAVHHGDYPASIKKTDHEVKGLLLVLETKSQRKKLDDFEGEVYLPTAVAVTLEDGTTADADMYVWNGDAEALTTEEWKLEDFVKDRLEDWIDFFAGMEMVGDSDSE
ncbi:hypothetical protein FHETE_1624 [Fusarium heterosporum]|uniref:Putative gamma-glutamylcyclotransferase n=1 Tax=Fusarium heterosporum TaxID=42747 RepID=A0A8H5TVU0_FUSHE|nr:hypothetical protein FHETE_1624 [Fusarium heterosporum]